MAGYTSQPAGPFIHIDAVKHLRERHDIPARDAAELLLAAEQSESGMAKLARRGYRTVWVTHMTTQQGRYMVELD